MKDLNLNQLLRYVLAGGVGLLTLFVAYPCCLTTTQVDASMVSLLFGIALIFGSIIYTFHRAVLYPLIYRHILRCMKGEFEDMGVNRSANIFRPSNLEIKLDTRLWQLRASSHYANKPLSEWGSQVHFLYCTCWAVLSAMLAGLVLCNEYNLLRMPLLVLLALLIFRAAFISEHRCLIFFNRIKDENF